MFSYNNLILLFYLNIGNCFYIIRYIYIFLSDYKIYKCIGYVYRYIRNISIKLSFPYYTHATTKFHVFQILFYFKTIYWNIYISSLFMQIINKICMSSMFYYILFIYIQIHLYTIPDTVYTNIDASIENKYSRIA